MAKYLKQDCIEGYIDDNAEIEYTQFCNLRHTILGCMMGDFDTQGRYHVEPAIVDELIRMPKYLVDSMDNIEVCASELKLDRQLTFLVTFENDRVTLSLMEKISFEGNVKLNSGTYSNINEYVLDSIETSGVVNKNAIYSMWNIKERGGNALDVFNMDEQTIAAYFNIVNRFKYLMVANTILLENQQKLEEVESGYANRMLDILKAYPKLKTKVEKELKTTLEEKKDFIKIDKPNFAKTINEIIEKAIENNIDVLNDKEKESFKQEKHQAQMETNILRREAVDLEIKPAETSQEIDNLNVIEAPFEEYETPGQKDHTIPVLSTQGRETGAMAEIVEGLAQAREAVAVVDATAPIDNSVKGKKGTNETSTLIAVIGEIVPLETLRTETPAPAVETPVEVAAPATDATEVRPATAPITPEVRPASAVDAVTPARDNSGVGAVRVSGGSGEKLNNSGVETEGDSHGGEDKVRVGGQGRGFGSDSLSDYIVDDDTLSGAGSGGNGETPVAADVEEPDISEDLGNVEAGAENVGGGIMAMLLSQSSKTSGETDVSASVGGENIAAVQNAMQHEAENVENILDQ